MPSQCQRTRTLKTEELWRWGTLQTIIARLRRQVVGGVSGEIAKETGTMTPALTTWPKKWRPKKRRLERQPIAKRLLDDSPTRVCNSTDSRALFCTTSIKQKCRPKTRKEIIAWLASWWPRWLTYKMTNHGGGETCLTLDWQRCLEDKFTDRRIRGNLKPGEESDLLDYQNGNWRMTLISVKT